MKGAKKEEIRQECRRRYGRVADALTDKMLNKVKKGKMTIEEVISAYFQETGRSYGLDMWMFDGRAGRWLRGGCHGKSPGNVIRA